MAYDEGTAERLRELFEIIPFSIERKMFGSLGFMVHGHMACGVINDQLMVRVGKAQYEVVLKEPFVKEMDFTGRALTGFIYVEPEGFESDEELEGWVSLSLAYVLTLPAK
ncbi:MAG: TfoX/Sxy family protein [Gammaproteobacteria bacterium]|jgi:TfoX/Sxy family transcriptional regulator of competence genes